MQQKLENAGMEKAQNEASVKVFDQKISIAWWGPNGLKYLGPALSAKVVRGYPMISPLQAKKISAE